MDIYPTSNNHIITYKFTYFNKVFIYSAEVTLEHSVWQSPPLVSRAPQCYQGPGWAWSGGSGLRISHSPQSGAPKKTVTTN